MITIVGTGHVFKIGHKVEAIILNRRPQCVCLELDRDRFWALTHRDEIDPRGVPVAYRMMADFQERIAGQYGAKVGEEMEAAANAAKSIGAAIACIDMNAQVAFNRVWVTMPFEERVKLAVTIFASLFARRRSVESEVKRFEDDSSAYMNEFGEQFPTIKKVLIDDRNLHMAKNIEELHAKFLDMVIVVGDGHVEGLTRLLSHRKDELEIIRLRSYRNEPPEPIRPKEPPKVDGHTVGYSFEAE